MRTRPFLLSLILSAGLWAGHALAQTGPDPAAASDRIGAEYQAARARCAQLDRPARAVCVKEAKGKRRVARAELNFMREPSDHNARAVQRARAKARYSVARQRCRNLPDAAAQRRCQAEARGAR